MPLNLFYTMVQKSQKWPKTQIKGGGPALKYKGENNKGEDWQQSFIVICVSECTALVRARENQVGWQT